MITKRYILLVGMPHFEQLSIINELEINEDNGFTEHEIIKIAELKLYEAIPISDKVTNRTLIWRIF
jgi:hypothetical protein